MSAARDKTIKAVLAQYPEEYREQAASLIPDESFAKDYTHRDIKGHQDFEYFDSAQRLYHNVLMVGPTGSGKTTAAKAYGSHLAVPHVRVEFQRQTSVEAVFGRNDYKDGKSSFKPGDMFIALHGPSVVLFDEISNINAGSFAFAHGLLDAGGSVFVPQIGRSAQRHEKCNVFAAYNDKYEGNQPLSEAGRNRFAYPLKWGYDPAVEDERVGAYSKTLLQLVRNLRQEEKIHTDIGTNAMEEFILIAHDMSVEAAIYLFTNRFDDSEQWAVQSTLEAESVNIADQLGITI